jgi:hypothetical protein
MMLRAFLADSGGERKKKFVGNPLLHPPDARPHTPAKDFVLCTPKSEKQKS